MHEIYDSYVKNCFWCHFSSWIQIRNPFLPSTSGFSTIWKKKML